MYIYRYNGQRLACYVKGQGAFQTVLYVRYEVF